MATAHKLT